MGFLTAPFLLGSDIKNPSFDTRGVTREDETMDFRKTGSNKTITDFPVMNQDSGILNSKYLLKHWKT
jgi:hypothetical protein